MVMSIDGPFSVGYSEGFGAGYGQRALERRRFGEEGGKLGGAVGGVSVQHAYVVEPELGQPLDDSGGEKGLMDQNASAEDDRWHLAGITRPDPLDGSILRKHTCHSGNQAGEGIGRGVDDRARRRVAVARQLEDHSGVTGPVAAFGSCVEVVDQLDRTLQAAVRSPDDRDVDPT